MLSVPFTDLSSALDGGGTRVHAKFLLKSPNAVLEKENYRRVPLIPTVMITQCISFAKFIWSQPYAPEVSNYLVYY